MKLKLLAVILLSSLSLVAQIPANGTQINTILMPDPVSGSQCITYNQIRSNPVTGNQWQCINPLPTVQAFGTWVQTNSGGSGGGAVASVFGRTGAVVASSGDYSTFYTQKANNLSDVSNKSQSLVNLGVTPSFANCAGIDPTDSTDSAAAINACLAANPSGSIYLPPGVYKVNSTITSNRQQMIIGGQAGSSVIDCTGLTSTTCWVVGDTNLSGNASFARGGLSNIAINGPGIGSSKIGLFIGADITGVISPTGFYGFGTTFNQLIVQQFGFGVEWGNNTWNLRFPGSIICYNGIGLYSPGGLSNTGESASFDGSDISNNTIGIQDDGGVLFDLSGASVDYNGLAVTGGWLMMNANGVHFEQTTGPVVSFHGNNGFNSFFNSHGTSYVIAGGSGTETGIIITTASNSSVLVEGGSVRSNHTIAQLIDAANGTQVSTPQALPAPMVNVTNYADQVTTTTNGQTIQSLSSAGLTIDHPIYALADPSTGYGVNVNPATSGGSNGSGYGSTGRAGTSNGAGWTIYTANNSSGLKWNFGFCPGASSDDLCLFNFPLSLPALRADVNTNFVGLGSNSTPPALLSVGSSAQFQVNSTGNVVAPTYNTLTNCSSSASPAVCGSAASGSVTVAATATTKVVNTSVVTANSVIMLTFDSSLGTKLGVTCNTTPVLPTVSARTASTSFTLTVGTTPTTNPACFSYVIFN